MQNVAPQYGPGAQAGHQTGYPQPENSPTGGSTTSTLRQFRKKDAMAAVTAEKQLLADHHAHVTESHVARVAPHNHYPPQKPPNHDYFRYQQQQQQQQQHYQGEYGMPPQSAKYSEINDHLQNGAIQKQDCGLQQNHMKNTYLEHVVQNGYHADVAPQMQYLQKDVQQMHHGYKPESQYYQKDPTFQHQMQKYGHVQPQMRKYPPQTNDFLSKLRRIHPEVARNILTEHQHQENAQNYPNIDQRNMYQNQRYYPGTMQTTPYPPQQPYYSPYAPCAYGRPSQRPATYGNVPQAPRGIPANPYGYPAAPYSTTPTPEYAQHYQHRRPCYQPQQFPAHHQEVAAPELNESRISPSDSLKKFIENWGTDDDQEMIGTEAPEEHRDQNTETVYMINASELQYFGDNGISLVEGGVPLENCQYVIKGGVTIDNTTAMVRIVENSNREDPDGARDKVVNLHLVEGATKSDCMLEKTKNEKKVVVHQNTVLQPAKEESYEEKLLVDKNCSPINIEQLNEDAQEEEARKTPKNMPIIDLFNENEEKREETESVIVKNTAAEITKHLNEVISEENDSRDEEIEEDEAKVESNEENSLKMEETVSIEESQKSEELGEITIEKDEEEAVKERQENSNITHRRAKRIFSVDDIIHNIGNKSKMNEIEERKEAAPNEESKEEQDLRHDEKLDPDKISEKKVEIEAENIEEINSEKDEKISIESNNVDNDSGDSSNMVALDDKTEDTESNNNDTKLKAEEMDISRDIEKAIEDLPKENNIEEAKAEKEEEHEDISKGISEVLEEKDDSIEEENIVENTKEDVKTNEEEDTSETSGDSNDSSLITEEIPNSPKDDPIAEELKDTDPKLPEEISEKLPEDVQYRNAIKIEENSVLLEIAGVLVEITVNTVNGKKVLTVVPISNSAVVDFNDNYENFTPDNWDAHNLSEDSDVKEELTEENIGLDAPKIEETTTQIPSISSNDDAMHLEEIETANEEEIVQIPSVRSIEEKEEDDIEPIEEDKNVSLNEEPHPIPENTTTNEQKPVISSEEETAEQPRKIEDKVSDENTQISSVAREIEDKDSEENTRIPSVSSNNETPPILEEIEEPTNEIVIADEAVPDEIPLELPVIEEIAKESDEPVSTSVECRNPETSSNSPQNRRLEEAEPVAAKTLTKAAKKVYESELQIPAVTTSEDISKELKNKSPPHQINDVSSSKEKTEKKRDRSEQLKKKILKKSKRISEKQTLKEERKKLLKKLIMERREKKARSEHKDDEDYADFKELLRARKLKKMKKMQEMQGLKQNEEDAKVPEEKTDTKEVIIEETKDADTNVQIAQDKPPKENSTKVKSFRKRVDSDDGSSDSIVAKDNSSSCAGEKNEARSPKKVTFSDVTIIHQESTKPAAVVSSRDPRKSAFYQVMVPSVSEILSENELSSRKKRKLSLEEYNSRKKKNDDSCGGDLKRSRSEDLSSKKDEEIPKEIYQEKLGITLKWTNDTDVEEKPAEIQPILSEIKEEEKVATNQPLPTITNNNWEDSQSPKRAQPPTKEEPTDFSRIISKTTRDSDPPRPKDHSLEAYKEQVDSKLSSLNIQIPKVSKTPSIISKFNANDLFQRFLNNDKLSVEEMDKIRKIITYKRLMQSFKPPETGASPRNSNYEVRSEDTKIHLKKVPLKRRRFKNLDVESSSDSSDDDTERGIDYSVVQSGSIQSGVPKLIIKRKVELPQPVVRLERLDVDVLKKRKCQ